MSYERGSEWRRWDLHIHTPETKKNDQFSGSTVEEKWNHYYEAIQNYIGDGKDDRHNIAVMGITDYLSIDNYLKVIQDDKLPESVQMVLPNVEMRVIPIANKAPINIHFLFAPEIVEELEDRFFGKLTFDNGDREYTATHNELVQLGKSIIPNATREEAYKKGIEQFVPTMDSIKKVFKNDKSLRENTLIGVSNSSNDGVSGAANNSAYFDTDDRSSQLGEVRKSLYKFADFVFSANKKDIQYFLGEGVDDEKTVKENCGALMPCLHGSDAHELDKIFAPDGERYCWIKADPTFNGLRQVIYEPKARVRIEPLKPETKADYHVIDKIIINNSDFTKVPIYFNDKLTCIIGGKSTGKSLLLNNIARAIDQEQVQEKVEKANSRTKIIDGVSVYWADGTVSDSGRKDLTHKIVYIPQTYLNRLSDENEETTEIDDIIQDIVLIDEECKQAYANMNQKIKEHKPFMDKKIYDLIQTYETMETKTKSKLELGTILGIKKEIEKLKGEKDLISRESKLSQEELEQYEKAIKLISKQEKAIKLLDEEISQVSLMNHIVLPIEINFDFSDDVMTDITDAMGQALTNAEKIWNDAKGKILEKLQKKRKEVECSLQNERETKQRLGQKVVENEAIAKLAQQIKNEEEKLVQYEELEKQYATEKKKYGALLDDLSNLYFKFRDFHEEYKNIVNNNSSINADGLEFFVEVPFKSESFVKDISSNFDKRVLKTKKAIFDYENFSPNDFNSTMLKLILDECITGKLPLTKGAKVESALREILSDWYNTTYNVRMDNDTINEMSPGKKALVLLKLLINLADSKCPILIDQPEDDLDNRSVFEELIPFVKDKKITRQIVIVTHNANVVLGGDAEEIIVANQSGNNSPNKEARFEYRSGSIENNKPIYTESGELEYGVLNQKGIQQHICDVLEGGEKAFDLRKHKYRI